MQNSQRYFLSKTDRLKSRKAIDLLFEKGKSFAAFPLKIVWMKDENNPGLKAGFTVSSRNFKKATDRNRIKRLMREAYRLQKNELQNRVEEKGFGLHVFMLFTGREKENYSVVAEKTAILINRLCTHLHEKS